METAALVRQGRSHVSPAERCDVTIETQTIPSQDISPESAHLSQVEASYSFRDEEAVRHFLQTHPHLIEVLFEAQFHLLRHFGPDSQVTLEVFPGPESEGEKRLFAYIIIFLPVEEALTRLDKLDEEWFLNQSDRVDGLLNFSLEVAPLSFWQTLEAAADQGDGTAFIRAARRIAWSRRPADDFVRAVHLALTVGAHACPQVSHAGGRAVS